MIQRVWIHLFIWCCHCCDLGCLKKIQSQTLRFYLIFSIRSCLSTKLFNKRKLFSKKCYCYNICGYIPHVLLLQDSLQVLTLQAFWSHPLSINQLLQIQANASMPEWTQRHIPAAIRLQQLLMLWGFTHPNHKQKIWIKCVLNCSVLQILSRCWIQKRATKKKAWSQEKSLLQRDW